MFSLSNIKQLNLFEQISELNHLSAKQPIGFLNLLSDNFDLESFISESFSSHYYSTLGRDREYKLTSILSTLILMQIFHIPTNILLHLFLYSLLKYENSVFFTILFPTNHISVDSK
jgi:hypothetical protein